MAVQKVVHIKDLLKCNHGGTVDLEPTEERNTEIKDDLRVVTNTDLLEKVTISGCSRGCTKITGITTGLADDVELKDGAIPVVRTLRATTNRGCTVTWKGFEFNIDDAVDHLNQNAHARSTGYCARYVQDAIRAGGIDIEGANANVFGPVLQRSGFESVATNSTANYTPQTGDIVQFPGVNGHPYGHTAMWNGTQWVSDFRQNSIFVANGYRTSGYTVYRIKVSGNQAHAEPE